LTGVLPTLPTVSPGTMIPTSHMNQQNDTIAAIATGPGEAGICIVRISGPASLKIADKVFRCKGKPPSLRNGGTFTYGHVTGAAPESSDIDEAILLIYRAPHSYTREDTVEIQGHGGLISARRILRRAIEAGARPAEPGEFTKRAFLSGRIDLLQAEAVLDLVRASSDRAAAAAVEQLKGSLSAYIQITYASILSVIADIESSLDFPEDELAPISVESVETRLFQIQRNLKEILSTWQDGHVLREGILTVISGKPNAGKSTLFNTLLGTSRAIVTHHPGTTRDTIEENLILDGVVLKLVDTAGLREATCEIEREGVLRAQSQIERADLRIHVLDASQPADKAEIADLQRLVAARTIVVLNKTDMSQEPSALPPPTLPMVRVSLTTGMGVNNLKTTLAAKLASFTAGPVHATISERHRQILSDASNSIREASDLLRSGKEDTLPPAASILRNTAETLAFLIGHSYHEDLLNQIFSRFCIGK